MGLCKWQVSIFSVNELVIEDAVSHESSSLVSLSLLSN